MKRTSKIISLVLAVVMLFTMIPFSGSATAVIDTTKVDSIEKLIRGENLAATVNGLVALLDGSTDTAKGTILKLVLYFLRDDENVAKIVGEDDILSYDKDAAAEKVVDYLDAVLADATKDITDEAWYDTVTDLISDFDLSSVKGVVTTLYKVKGLTTLLGDTGRKMEFGSIEKAKNANNDFDVIKYLIAFLKDNAAVITDAVTGDINLGTALNSLVADINVMMQNLPVFLKASIYRLVDGYAAKPDLEDDPSANVGTTGEKGAGFGKSVYADYTADQLLAVALIRIIKKADVETIVANATKITKEEANAALDMSFYKLLSENCQALFDNYEVKAWLNDNVNSFVDSLGITPEIKALFNTDIEFVDADFTAIFAGAKKDGILAQINNIAKLAITKALKNPSAITLNDSMNHNVEALIKFALPYLAQADKDGKLPANLTGVFTKYTADYIADKSLAEIAVDALKLFFGDWFDGADAAVKKANSLAQLGVIALYYTIDNNKNIKLEGVSDQLDAAKEKMAVIDTLGYDACKELALDTAAAMALGAMNYNGDKFGFSSPAKATDGYTEMLGYIANWALKFANGIPAVISKAHVNDFDVFYKLNVILNELIDFSFINGCSAKGFKLETETALNKLIDCVCTLDFDSLFAVFAINDNAGNILNGKVIPGVLSFLNRAVTGLFEHTCKAAATTYEYYTGVCNNREKHTVEYCENNGHVISQETETDGLPHNYVKIDDARNKPASCTTKGTQYYQCTACNEIKANVKPADIKELGHGIGNNTGKVEPTCQEQGYNYYVCTRCLQTIKTTSIAKVDHVYENGTCKWCKQAEPNATPVVVLKEVQKYKVTEGDGDVKAADARLILRAAVGLETFTVAQLKAIGLNEGDKPTSAEARMALRTAVGLETKVIIKI